MIRERCVRSTSNAVKVEPATSSTTFFFVFFFYRLGNSTSVSRYRRNGNYPLQHPISSAHQSFLYTHTHTYIYIYIYTFIYIYSQHSKIVGKTKRKNPMRIPNCGACHSIISDGRNRQRRCDERLFARRAAATCLLAGVPSRQRGRQRSSNNQNKSRRKGRATSPVAIQRLAKHQMNLNTMASSG